MRMVENSNEHSQNNAEYFIIFGSIRGPVLRIADFLPTKISDAKQQIKGQPLRRHLLGFLRLRPAHLRQCARRLLNLTCRKGFQVGCNEH